jgi:hypothetical protein
MPHPRKDKHWIPLEDWAEYIPTPEIGISEMPLRRLIVLAENLTTQLDEVFSTIEKRIKEGKSLRRLRE